MPQTTTRSIAHMFPTLDEELRLTRAGYGPVAGVDEVGRGAWAGPLVAAAVVLPPVFTESLAAELAAELAGVRDSKTCPPEERTLLDGRIRAVAHGVAVGMASPLEIDRFGLNAANVLAMQRAVDALPWTPGHLLLDWVRLPDCPVPQRAFAKGDRLSLSIAAASIVAKVARDALLTDLDGQYDGFDFARHKGYGTAIHRAALRAHGPTAEHRYRFAPVHAAAVARWTRPLFPAEAAPVPAGVAPAAAAL